MKKGFLSRPAPENSRAIPGALFHFLAKGDQTEKAYALLQIEVHRGAAPPAHVHAHEHESYYILEGSIKFFVGEEVVVANKGDMVHLPNHLMHTFEVVSESANVLMLISPAGLEQWFWENSAPAPDMKALPPLQGPPPADVITHQVNTLRDYGVEMVA